MKSSEICTKIALSKDRGQIIDDLKEGLKGQDLSRPNENGTYPIHEMATADLDMIDFAIAQGADINAKSGQGYTPLEIAVARGHTAIVKACLKHGADTESRDRYGNTPLVSAVLAGKKAFEIVDLLLDAGADPDAVNKNGLSARILADEDNHPSFKSMT